MQKVADQRITLHRPTRTPIAEHVTAVSPYPVRRRLQEREARTHGIIGAVFIGIVVLAFAAGLVAGYNIAS